MTMRDSMIIYRSFFEAIKELPKEQQADVWNAVYELGLNGNEITLEGISKTIFTLIKPQIEANLKKYINGKKPKRSKEEAKNKQTRSKTEGNVNDNVNDNVNNNNVPSFDVFLSYAVEKVPNINKEDLELKYYSWLENNWSITSQNKKRKIVNWKSTLLNTLPYLRKDEVQTKKFKAPWD